MLISIFLFSLASIGIWLHCIRGPCEIERLLLIGLDWVDREVCHRILSYVIHELVRHLILLIRLLIQLLVLLLEPLCSFSQASALLFQPLHFLRLLLDILLAFLDFLLQLLGLVSHPLFFVPDLHVLVLTSLISFVSFFLHFFVPLFQFCDMNLLNFIFLLCMPKLVI